MKNIYTSVDIGSDTIKVIVCELFNGRLNLLAASSIPSKGIKKGVIVNPEEAKIAVKQAFNEVELMLGVKITKTLATVPAYFADFTLVKGSISVSKEGDPINGDDIVEVLQKSIQNKMLPERELITILPIDFVIDGNAPITDPKGEVGDVLEARAIMVTTPKKNIYSVLGLVEGIGVEVVDISLSGIANIFALKNKEIANAVGAIIDIGADTTTISIYNKGIIVKNSIIQLGGKNIDNDLAYVFKTNLTKAKKIKEKFAYAYKNMASNTDLISIKNESGEEVNISQFAASEVVMSRIEEILLLIKKELGMMTSKGIDYVLITGGTSNMTHFNHIAEDILGKDVIISNMKLMGIRNNKYSVALGNIIYFINKLKLKGSEYTMFNEHDIEVISSTKKNILNVSNESMLGKVFVFFWGE